jgi:glycerate kinase
MRILIAPDKFKGSLGAREVAESIASGMREVLPDASIELQPVADGGEGTADLICRARGGEWLTCAAHDALGRAIEARYVWLGQSATAVIEMGEAAGAWRIDAGERDVLRANTFGVGEMLRDAAQRRALKIVVGLGGSATNDGGFGMARSLGFRFLPKDGSELTGDVAELRRLARIERPRRVAWPAIVAAVDVRNPLLGPRGATRMFGPQKGASLEKVEILEQSLTQLAAIVARDLGLDPRDTPGAGAAGGLGFGLMGFCGARIRSGFDVVAEITGLESAIQKADIIITGEGSLDEQTIEGKAPAGVARLARKCGKRVFAIVGAVALKSDRAEPFERVFSLARGPITVSESIQRTAELLRERAHELAGQL